MIDFFKWFPATCYVYSSMFVWTVLYCIVMLPVFLVAKLLGKADQKFLLQVIAWYGRLIVRVAIFPVVRVQYEEQIDYTRKPAGIFIFNHRSGSDPFLMALIKRQSLVQVVNGWPMRLPFWGFFARKAGYIDVTKMEHTELRDYIRELLGRGIGIIAFPEGTRSGSKEMNPFRSGIFHVAHELNAPLYPGCIVGNEKIPDRKFRFHAGKIIVRMLPPVMPSPEKNAFVLKKKIHKLIYDETKKMEAAA